MCVHLYAVYTCIFTLSLVEVDKGKHGVEWLMNSVSLGLDKHEWMQDIKGGES